VLDGKCGGKLAFAKWSYQNMLVWAQIESREVSESLDGIPTVEGLTTFRPAVRAASCPSSLLQAAASSKVTVASWPMSEMTG